tara:strand:- start:4049 stop:4513 length:465 start_codon:yes stop_codon:yes gene_type:complete
VKVTKHFSAAEMTTTASSHDNTPTVEAWVNLARLCCEVLEPLRALCGPLRVNSGYRSPDVNTAIGGAKNSAHTYGRAADLVPIKNGNALDLVLALKDSGIPFDKAILEYRGQSPWLHVQVRNIERAPRGRLLMSLSAGVFEEFDETDQRLEEWK